MSTPDTEWIAIRQWDSYARRMERRHLRRYGASLSSTAIARRANAFIVEIQTERIRVRTGWRETMQQAADEAHPYAAQDPPTPSPKTISTPPGR